MADWRRRFGICQLKVGRLLPLFTKPPRQPERERQECQDREVGEKKVIVVNDPIVPVTHGNRIPYPKMTIGRGSGSPHDMHPRREYGNANRYYGEKRQDEDGEPSFHKRNLGAFYQAGAFRQDSGPRFSCGINHRLGLFCLSVVRKTMAGIQKIHPSATLIKDQGNGTKTSDPRIIAIP